MRVRVLNPSWVCCRLLCGAPGRCGTPHRGGPELGKRHLLCCTYVDLVKFTPTLPVGTPVPAPALVSRLLATCREGPHLAAEGKARGRAQPGIPGGCPHGESALLSVPLIEQDIFLDHSDSLLLVAHVYLKRGSVDMLQDSIPYVL